MGKLIFTLLLGVAMLTGSAATAADSDESKIFPYQYTVHDLDNGLRVVIIPTDYPNIVSLQIPVQTGSRNEVEPGKSGFAHFFEHMMFRGTEKYPSDKYNAVLKNTGADQNAYTTDDLTNYYMNFSKDDLEIVLEVEADRFMNLKYPEADFKTEAKAVLGEYNKNSANPVGKIIEVQRNAAFQAHTYKHTTMGFIEDIENMPNQFDYSLEFFDRYYRPGKTILILAGDLDSEKTLALVKKYWGKWKSGSYTAEIPVEPDPTAPLYENIEWSSPTLPWVTVAFRGPEFSSKANDKVACDLIAEVAFSSGSPLYQKMVVKEQKVDQFWAYFPDRMDPNLLTVAARVKNVEDIWYVRDEIMKEFAKLRTELVSARQLADIQSNVKYAFASGLDNSEAIAGAVSHYLAMTRDMETVNKVYDLYDGIEPQDIQRIANKYFIDKGLVTVTLAHEKLPEVANTTGSVDAFVEQLSQTPPPLPTILMQNSAPLVNVKFMFKTGSAIESKGKEGLAQLTANMLTDAGSQTMKYAEIRKALYPMAAGFGNQVDKEMTVFSGAAHVDNLVNYYGIISDQLLKPAWSEDDFTRVKSNLINEIKVSLRENNEEELGKEALYEFIYENHPYGALTRGLVASIDSLTLDDLKKFYLENYTQSNLVIGLAGGYSDSFLSKVKRDFAGLPKGDAAKVDLPMPAKIMGHHAVIVQKETRATAISFGFPIDVNRNHPDFAALWLARSYLGEHRSSNSYLYQRIRKIRGMNYGDYAYIEYFPNGMFRMQPSPNYARTQQIFQVWIRPVESIENAHFATRVAMFEINKLVKNGMTQKDFKATRNYLVKYVNILTATQGLQLGYALDSDFYDMGDFNKTITENLKKLTLKDVNRAIQKHLQDENVKFVFITKDAAALKERLITNATSTISYQSEKPEAILEEDKVIQDYKLKFKPETVTIKPVKDVFVK